ncbi:MAG TPA: response regulator [Chloroflexota bacterium]|nr:response regulator [Chloroflexota bacterium]
MWRGEVHRPYLIARYGESARAPGAYTANGRVLAVGDHDNTRRVLSSLARIEGCDVREARSGPEAFEIMARWAPNMLLLDLPHPTDPPAAKALLRSYRAASQLPVAIVVLTETALTAAEEAEIGAERALAKPFSVVQVLQSLQEFAACG